MAEQEFTMYKDMEPDEISRKFWGADYLVDLVMMVGLGFVIIAAAWMANKGQTWAFIPATISLPKKPSGFRVLLKILLRSPILLE